MSAIAKPFAYHKPSADALQRITTIREAFTQCQAAIMANSGASRERSVALTELETSAMWAIKSVVTNDPASTPDLGAGQTPP